MNKKKLLIVWCMLFLLVSCGSQEKALTKGIEHDGYRIVLEKAQIGEMTKTLRLTYTITGEGKKPEEIEKFAYKLLPAYTYSPRVSVDGEKATLVMAGHYADMENYEDALEIKLGTAGDRMKCEPVETRKTEEKEFSVTYNDETITVIVSPFSAKISFGTKPDDSKAINLIMEMKDGTKSILARLPVKIGENTEYDVPKIATEMISETDGGYLLIFQEDIDINSIEEIIL